MWNTFVRNLACRLNNENDLSDVTWAMCQTSQRFKCAFLQFFFPELKKDCESVWIEREGQNDDSRPDFIFSYNGNTYLIENKIYDTQHHFKQYIKTYKISPSQLGYIMNYPWAEEGFTTHTWKEFYQSIQNKVPKEEAPLWNAYLEYIKKVCNIYLPMNTMSLKGMNSLYIFYTELGNIIAIDNEYFNSNISDKDKQNGGNGLASPRNGALGKYFKVHFKGIYLRDARGWIGVYFSMEQPLICIGFQRGKGDSVYNLIEQNLELFKDAKLASKPYEEDGVYWYDFIAPEDFDDLTLNKQTQILKKFYQSVMMSIYNIKANLLGK